MLKNYLIIGIVILFIFSSFSSIVIGFDAEKNNLEKPPILLENTWSLRYGKIIFSEEGKSICITDDGGYIVIGTANHLNFKGIMALKLSGNGEIIWEKTYMTNGASARHVEQTMDGGLVIVGEGMGGIRLIKTDGNGNEEWNKVFSDTWTSGDHPLQQTDDDGYILICSTHSDDNTITRLIKTDENGNEEWSKFFGINGDNGRSIEQTIDDGYIITGRSRTYGVSNPYKTSAWLIKTDEYGNEEWNRTYGEGYVTRGFSVHQTYDNGYIIAGQGDEEGVTYGWLIKTDDMGNKIWDITFETYGCSILYSVIETPDEGYIATGTSGEGNLIGADLHLFKVKSDGSVDWIKQYGKNNFCEMGVCVRNTLDGGFVIVGSKQLFNFYAGLSPMFLDIWILKTDELGNVEAIDTLGAESDWASLEISMPKQNHIYDNVTIEIKGGIGITVEIHNKGDTIIPFINHSITIDSPFIFLGYDTSSNLSNIMPGEILSVWTGVIGLGTISASVQIDDIIESRSGIIIGPFVIL